jgi:hypothetical protein
MISAKGGHVLKLDKAMLRVGQLTTLLKLGGDLGSITIIDEPFFHLGRLNASS